MEAPFQPGAVLAGKYVILREIGRGGSGFVLAAEHVVLKQRVAVKLLHDEVSGIPEATARFLREAQTVARLTSVHTVRIMDADRLQTGRPYIVMEYLEGRDLRTVAMETGRMDVHVAANYVAQACEGIAEAHARGVVHRDLKPSNLFLTADGVGRPLVKVLDFGVSKLSPLPGDRSDNLDITRSCQVFGSPRFMSPEQMRSSRDADARTDIWSLGVTLFVLASGRYPFEGEGLVGLERAVRLGPRPALDADAPAALRAIVDRCLELEPSRRYQTVAELGFELTRFAGDERSSRAAVSRSDQPGMPAVPPLRSYESLSELPSRELHTVAPGVGSPRPVERRITAEEVAANSLGWGPIVVEQSAAPAARGATRATAGRVALVAFGAAAAAAVAVWLAAQGAAHRTEAARGEATPTDPVTAPATAAGVPVNPVALTTSVAAPANGDSPTPGGAVRPSSPERSTARSVISTPSSAARVAARSPDPAAERAIRRAAAEPPPEQTPAAAAPPAASPVDTTLRDFDLIHKLPRR